MTGDRIDTDAVRKRHRRVQPLRHTDEGMEMDGPPLCVRCPTSGWPCDATRLADEVDRLSMEHADLLAEARREVDRLTTENTALMGDARL